MAVDRLTEDQSIDMLVELENAFKGFGGPAEPQLGPAMEKVVAVANEYRRLNDQMVAAGVKPSTLAGLQELQLGRMKGNVPMPYIKRKGPMEKRVHAALESNPVTGREEIVPIMNPDDPTTALVSTYGVTPKEMNRGDVDQADEIVTEMALRLMGNKVNKMPYKLTSKGQTYFPADFEVTTPSGDVVRYDGMQYQTGKDIPMLTHSAVAGVDARGQAVDRYQTQQLINSKLQQGNNLFQAIDSLAKEDKLYMPDIARKSGKVVKGDRSKPMAPMDRYDGLIMPGYSAQVRDAEFAMQPRNMVTPPEAIMFGDLDLAAKAIKAKRAGYPKVIHNQGGGGYRPKTHKVVSQMREDSRVGRDRVFADLVGQHPVLAQLLNKETMESLRIR